MALNTNEENNTGSILLVEPDSQKAGEIRFSLNQAGYDVDVVRGHLKALSRLDEYPFDIGIVPVESTDLQGFEFCRLVRNREREFNLTYTYLLLCAPERLRFRIIEKCEQADDFIIEPYLQSELHWRLKKGLNILEAQRSLSKLIQVDPETGVLNKKGLDLYFQEEVNRLSRKQDWVSLIALGVQGLERMELDYGTVWVNWLKQQIAYLLRKNLRNYDRLGKLDEGLFLLFAPETPPEGIQCLIKRLQSDLSYWSGKEGLGLPQELRLRVKALSLQAKLDYRGQRKAVQSIWDWIDGLTTDELADTQCIGLLDNSGIHLDE